MSDDFPQSTLTGGNIAVGGSATGSIETVSDEDWFRAILQGGRTYRIDLEGASTSRGSLVDPYLRGIHDGSGSYVSLTSDDDSGDGLNSRLDFVPTTTGTYYISAGAYSTYTGTYRLALADLTVADDFRADTSTTGSVAIGGSATGRIESASDQDWFAVSLVVGRTYRFDLQGAAVFGGSLSDPYLQGLYSANGSAIANTSDDDSGGSLNSQLTYTAATTGTHYLAARGYGSATGTYRVLASDVGTLDDLPSNSSTTGRIGVGGTATGRIDLANDTDWFQASLVAGRAYTIDLMGSGSGNGTLADPYLRGVFNAAGSLLPDTTDDDSGSAGDSRLSFVADQTGLYYIAAGAFGSATGTYRLALADTGNRDDFAATTATAGTLAMGGSSTGNIERSGDEDWFAVNLTEGQTYRIDLHGTTGGGGTLADTVIAGIHRADGTLLDDTENDDFVGLDSQVTYTAASTGIHFIAAAGYGSNTGTYRLGIVNLGSTDDYAATSATTGRVSVNGTSAGTIGTPNDQDWFAVTLTGGVAYRVELRQAPGDGGTLADPFLRGIYNGAGTLLPDTSDDDSGGENNSRVDFTPGSTGTYYVAAGGFGSNIGRYVLSVEQRVRSDEFSDTIASLGRVTAGAAGSSGGIDFVGDRDLFQITLTAGVPYQIDLIGLEQSGGSLGDPYLYGLRDASGTLIMGTADDDSGDGQNSRVLFTPSSTGTYFVDAGAFGSSTGTYTLAVANLGGADDFSATTATTGRVTVGGSSFGTIEAPGDRDWFAITLTAGRAYRIELEGRPSGAGTLPDTILHGVYNSAGTLIAGTTVDDSSGLNSVLGFAPTSTGTYFIAAGAFGRNTGTYKVSVRDTGGADDYLASTATAGRVSVGGSVSGNIETSGDTDWFSVTLNAGTRYRIDQEGTATGGGSLTDPFLRGIYGSTGVLLPSTTDDDAGSGTNALVTFAPTATGTYFIAAGAYRSFTGGYKLSVTNVGSTAPPDDFLATTGTTGSVTVGGNRTGNIETAGDQDWFRVSLSANTTYRIDLEGAPTSAGTLADPIITGIFNSAGTLINGTVQDDGGTGRNSRSSFTPTADGTYYIGAGGVASGTGSYKLSLTQTATAPPPTPGGFSIDVRFTGDTAYQQYFVRAAATWTAIITGDIPDVNTAALGFVDDLRINASVVPIDGPGRILAQAGPTEFRSGGSSLPYLGIMQFDVADLGDLVSRGTLQDVIEHEMGHVLGIGTLWGRLGLINTTTSSYFGANALREYRTLSGNQGAGSVPLESGGGSGTRNSHWSETVFRSELMTGYAESAPPMPLSRLTIGTLQDMGYQVNYGAAESYTLPLMAGLSGLTGDPSLVVEVADPAMVAAAAPADFAGTQIAFLQNKPVTLSAVDPEALKLDGTITQADASVAYFIDTTTGNGYTIQLVGTFDRNDPTTAAALKGTVTGMTISAGSVLLETYDFTAAPRDVRDLLNSYLANALSGPVLIDARATVGQNDSIVAGDNNDALYAGGGDDVLDARGGNDTLDGGSGNDLIDGGGGNDLMIGGAGDDTFVVDSSGDMVREMAFQGADTALVRINSWTVAPNIEIIRLAGTAFIATGGAEGEAIFSNPVAGGALSGGGGDDLLSGSGLAEYFNGGIGNDTINGLGGPDTMLGGAGNDLFVISNPATSVTELAGEGTDTASVSVNGWTASANLEVIRLEGVAFQVTGGPSGEQIFSNRLAGGALSGGGGDDLLSGTGLAEYFHGGSGNDTINGLGGADTMAGGSGDDLFVISHAATTVIESAGEGTADTASVSVNGWTAPANLEIIRLEGAAFQVRGGPSGEQIYSNRLAGGALSGGGGDDLLSGTALTEYFDGGAGNDTINGLAGPDTMVGGTGDDLFVISNVATVVIENAGEGTDTASVSVNAWSTGGNIEIIRLEGTAFQFQGGAGNEQIYANRLAGGALGGGAGDDLLSGTGLSEYFNGGSGNDTINGLGGPDTMVGGLGDDVYIVSHAATVVIENSGEGFDLASVSINGWTAPTGLEVVRLEGAAFAVTGSAGGEQIYSNPTAGGAINAGGGNDAIFGTALAEYFIGGAGNDTLTGGGGADNFAYQARGFGQDVVNGFVRGATKLDFRGSGIGFGELGISQSGSNVQVLLGGDLILLTGVTGLNAGDFLF